jgi:hypothetical protein
MSQSSVDDRPLPNIEIVTKELGNLLKQSETISNLDSPFYLTSNFPDVVTTKLYSVLLGLEKQVVVNPAYPVLELRLSSANRLIQESGNIANRILKGELQLILTNEASELLASESLRFNYSDNIQMAYFNDLETSWQGAAFQEKKRFEERNLWRSVGQPAIIAVATGVTVFLLFNVRSS